MKTIAFFDTKPYDKPAFLRYGEAAGLCYRFFETRLTPDTVRLCEGADGVCAFVNDDLGAEVLNALAKMDVPVVALRCAGYNRVDTEAAGRLGLTITRVPAYSPYAVAEHAMALLLTSIRRIHKAYIRTRDFNFSLNGLIGFDLHGKTVGVIGTGRIGRAFIDICRGFGMRVLAYDKYPADDPAIRYVPLRELLGESDVISLHCPLTDETYHMIGADTLPLMKHGVVIINTSRGALIDAEALLGSIKSRVVGAACLDVYEEESECFYRDLSGHIVGDDVLALLISMPNVIVTSHQGFLTREALDNIAQAATGSLTAFFAGKRSGNEVTAGRAPRA